MKIRTWEKAFWGIIVSFMVLSLIGISITKGDVKVTVQGEDKFISKGKAAVYAILFYLVVGLVIWLIVRLFVNSRDDKDKER